MGIEQKSVAVGHWELRAILERRQNLIICDNRNLHVQPGEVVRVHDDLESADALVHVLYATNVGLEGDRVAFTFRRIDDLKTEQLMGYSFTSSLGRVNQLKQWQVQGFENEEQFEQYKALQKLVNDGRRSRASLAARQRADEAQKELDALKERLA